MMRTGSRAIGCLAVLCAGILGVPLVDAHPELETQIAAATRQVEADPGDASLWLRRGELYRVHRDWARARADYLHARKIDPELDIDFHLGRMRFEAGQMKKARKHLNRFLEHHPDHARALVLRGRVLVDLGQPLAAVADYDRALELFDAENVRPDPAYYLERARALAAAGNRDEALRGLVEGLERWGTPITMQLLAIELELGLGRHDAALERLEQVAASANRQETWLVRRGKILESAGRPTEARAAYAAALEAIDALPLSRRGTLAMRRLEEQARAALENLEGDDPDTGG